MTDIATARMLLDRLVAFPTVSSGPNRALVEWVEGWLVAQGVSVTRIPDPAQPGKESLYATIGPAVDGGVVLSGHSDVVPIEGQDWTTDPWTVTERDGRLIGRGVCDMKGFDALAIAAMALAAKRPLKRPLQLALSHDEEFGCLGCIPMIEAMRALPRAAAVIVGEPTSMRTVTGHKGSGAWRIRIHGHEVHSSIMHTGVSAILEGAKILAWVNEKNAEGAAARPGLPFDPPWTTVHCGMIHGGTAHNITARLCVLDVGFRVIPGESLEDWRDALFAKVAEIEAGMKAVHPDTFIEIEEEFTLPALAPETDGAAETLARRLTGANATHVVSYATEAGQFQTRDWSVVVCGPGDIAQAHQPDEWIALSQIAEGWAFMERLVDELCR